MGRMSLCADNRETNKPIEGVDEYPEIQMAALRAGKRPPKKKKYTFDAVGDTIGVRYTNTSIPKARQIRSMTSHFQLENQDTVNRRRIQHEASVLYRQIWPEQERCQRNQEGLQAV